MKIDLEDFARETLREIPLLRHMQPRFSVFDAVSLTLEAPLAPNINDKQTAFGGSLAALATTCGWALASLIVREAELDCEVMIADSQLSYKAPVNSDFSIVARITPHNKKTLLQTLHKRARSAVTLEVTIVQNKDIKAVFTGTYVVKIKDAGPSAV